ncbi:MAG TPA: SLBB domain-containing protein [Steroidobacteraceae bacterium]
MAKGSLMRASGRCLGLVLVSLAAAAAVLSSHSALAQSSGSPTELLQLFQNMTPEQQDAITKQLGLGGGGGISGLLGGLGGASGSGSGLSREGTANRKRESAAQQPAAVEEGEDLPGLKAQDWVIIEVDVQPLPAPAGAQTPAPAVPAPIPSLPGGAGGASQNSLASLFAASASAPPAAPAAPAAALTPERAAEIKRLQSLADLIRSKDPYQLTRDGELALPGFAPIALLGLTDEEAALRLRVEPGLRGLSVRLTHLPLRKTGVAGLKPFGYDLFNEATPSTFAPVANVPLPADYIVGPGDEIDVQMYGNQTRSLKLLVTRDGRINLPGIGPISVSGQHFTSVKSGIEARVEHQMIGVRASVSMGDTRGLRVFVLGAARLPGTYTLSGLGTITSALYAAGGVRRIGSLRDVQLKRQGTLVRRLDLYDLLIRGDTADDAKLRDGDVVFVPPVGATASVSGEVRRPAIYELKGEASVAELVQLAGGLTPDADTSRAMLTGFDAERHRVVKAVDLSPDMRGQLLHNGDLLSVARTRPTIDSGIAVEGYVFAPGAFAWHQGVRLSSIIRSVDELQPSADLHYLLIRRELPPDRHVSVLSADLAAALAAPGSPADPELMPRDRITVFDLASGRDRVIRPVLDDLHLQSSADQPSQVVEVDGHVRVPGSYPLEPGMTVRDLIRAGGGTADEAYKGDAELVRYHVNGDTRRTELLQIDLAAALRNDPAANLVLQPLDTLSVKEVSEWGNQENITLSGEVRFPGRYSIRRGETLKSVIGRAGGLSPYAFPEGSVFTREELREREQAELDTLGDRMQRDVTLLALQAASAGQAGAVAALSVGQSLLVQVKGSKAVGRMVIDLPRLLSAAPGSSYDVILRGGDTLSVPRFQQQVTVIGEVQNLTSHLFNPRLSRDDYIRLSGGFTQRADRSKIYVVRASGSVVASESSRWFERNGSVQIKPGDTIVVPLDTEHIPALPLWQAVTTILYNIAIAVAAAHSL